MITAERVRQIDSEDALFAFLSEELHWPFEATPDTFPFFADELGLTDEAAGQVGSVTQIANFETGQPFGIFLVKFNGERVYQNALRRVLRGLSETRRDRDASLPAWKAPNLLFLCTTNHRDWTVARFSGETHTRATLSLFGWRQKGDEGLRTLCEYNLQALIYPENPADSAAWLKKWAAAFDVEGVTKRFYEEYEAVFTKVEAMLENVQGDRRLFTQCLFNRLMFVHFLSKKGWLKFNGRTDYLAALWEGRDRKANFYTAHLYHVFFVGLSNRDAQNLTQSNPVLASHIGEVPYLNGGLFEKGDCDGAGESIPDEAFDRIINGLFARFNFTVHESTPLDIEVAVDPEMLGKVFEELVTGRHELGSYYTPRPVVSFMCREALKGYLGGYAALVDERKTDGLSRSEIVALIEKLKVVRVVDPACGSGAYLLGMLHELFDLIGLLEVRADPLTEKDRHKRKLSLIQNSIYGVDKDVFAVNIARLRLWLSLAVEFEGETPEPLPNLDFRIGDKDSLTSPDPQGGQQPDIFRQQQIDECEKKKANYENPYYEGNKPDLKRDIDKLRQEIAEWAHPNIKVDGFDWRVEFPKVFERKEPLVTIGGAMNMGQGELTERAQEGGFDIVLANPPYVRQKDIGAAKPALEKLYRDATEGNSDLYCYFYARALQLLRTGGIHVFICSNSWLDVSYGGKLQGYLLERAQVQAIYDSAVERQFATADINTVISILQKGKPAPDAKTKFVSLLAPFAEAMTDASKRREITRTHNQLWKSGLGEPDKKGIQHYEGDKWGGKYLRAPDVFWKILERGKDKLIRLGSVAKVLRGFTTGVNDFFYVRVLNVEDGIATILCDDGSQHEIEAEYVAEPALVKAREIVRPRVLPSDLRYYLVRLDETAAEKPYAAEYIRWGEASRIVRKTVNGREETVETGQFHLRPTTKSRKPWYAVRIQDYAGIAFPMAHKRRAVIAALYGSKIHIDNRLYGVYPNDSSDSPFVAASLLSTFSTLCREIYGRANFGQGMLDMKVYEAEDLPILAPSVTAIMTPLISAFHTIQNRGILIIYDEVRRADRCALDDAFLLAVGFTDANERAKVLAELQDAACRCIWTRQAKAERTRESRQTYDEWLASGTSFGNADEE